jgi:hypothetical protein
MRLLPLLTLFWFAGCVNGPTTVSESDASLLQRAFEFEKSSRPIKITPETIVLDVRAFFDYQLLRVPGSLYTDANSFSLRRLHGEELEEAGVKMARRFALMGVNPFSHVVVVGYGAKGKGEEGSVALTLLALGVERVQVGTFESFKKLATNKQAQPPANKRYWEPRMVTSVTCPSHSTPEGFVVDVSGKSSGPINMAADKRLATLAKNWKDFVNPDDFSPNYRVREQLKGNQLDENSLIMVRGQQAPLVVFSLLQMGYRNACMLDD